MQQVRNLNNLRGPPCSGDILPTFITSAPGSSRRGISLPVPGGLVVLYEHESWMGSNGSFMLSSITIADVMLSNMLPRRREEHIIGF